MYCLLHRRFKLKPSDNSRVGIAFLTNPCHPFFLYSPPLWSGSCFPCTLIYGKSYCRRNLVGPYDWRSSALNSEYYRNISYRKKKQV
uniref:Uncharacterized protein n=1 Tax=Pararge aegeria TaxID=116150 RepID=S4PAI3_9NEOP